MLLLMMAFPVFYTLYLSFTNWTPMAAGDRGVRRPAELHQLITAG